MNDYLIRLWGGTPAGRGWHKDKRINGVTFEKAVDVLFAEFKKMRGTEWATHMELTKPTGETYLSLGY